MRRRNFIRITGGSAAFVTGAGILAACKTKKKSRSDNLKEQAFAAFERFKEVWDFDNFWKRGNTFDACLVFTEAAVNKWPGDENIIRMQQDITKMLKENLAYFNSLDVSDMWADDFGWWGLMALNARKHLLRNGQHKLAAEYFDLAVNKCWKFKKSIAYDDSDDAYPVPHGCSNGDANKTSKGVKNTVTNVLLFLLSSRIYKLTKEENIADNGKYLDMAYRQWIWLDSWFRLKEFQYLKMLTTSGALVQERPMAFIKGSGYTIKEHPPWEEGWVWSGDQGMLLAALTDMLEIKDDIPKLLNEQGKNEHFDKNAFENRIRYLINLIGTGVKNALFSTMDGIVREAPFKASFGPVHGSDYLGGRGILLRYLGDRTILKNTGIDFDKNITATTGALWQTRMKNNNQFLPEFTSAENDKLYIKQFRRLWGKADDVLKWDIVKMKEKNKHGVCQAIGLDILGARIRQDKSS